MPGFALDSVFGLCHDQGIVHQNLRFAKPLNTVETARKHRYVLDILDPFGNQQQGILLYLEKCTRPTPEFETITIHNGQDEIYRPGKVKWSPVEFTFYEKTRGSAVDAFGNDFGFLLDQTAEVIYHWWAETTAVISQSRHLPPFNYYKNAALTMLDGEGRPIWTYFLYDCWLEKVAPSDLSYTDTDIATITVIMRFNKAQER